MAQNLVAFLKQLEEDGVPQSEHLWRIDNFLSGKAWKDGIPFIGQFELTPLCNLNCKMCYVHLSHTQMREEKLLPVEQWIALIDQAFDTGMRRASLTGGECLTYYGFDDVYLYLLSKGVRTSILTNGVLLDSKRIEFLKLHKPFEIQVSLYGSCDEIYEQVTGYPQFETVWNNLQLAIQAGLPIRISITPNRFMQNDAEQLIEKANQLDVPYTINYSLFEPRADTGRSQDAIEASIDTYIRMYKKRKELNGIECAPIDASSLPAQKKNGDSLVGIKCGAGMNSFQISWNGEMYPCTNLRIYHANPLKDGFGACWNKLHEDVTRIKIPVECQDCPYETVCGPCIVPHLQNGPTGKCNPARCRDAKRYVSEGVFVLEKQC